MQKITAVILAISVAALVIGIVALLPQLRTVTLSDVGTENSTIPLRYQQPPDGKELTGNLTVYLLPVDLQKHESQDVIDIVLGVVGYIDAGHYSDLGASPQGQYGDETLEKPAETVKFYIDQAVLKPDGSPITRNDIAEYYSFGNGITCCGFTLKDGTDVGNVVIIIVDWAYDEYMIEKLNELRKALH